MRNLFNSVRRKPVKRNSFGLSFSNDFTTDYGLITPFLVFDTYAGEIFDLSNESFIRTQPLRAPAFTQTDVSYHWFFVPHRLVYDDWSDFIVRGKDGDTSYDKPYCTLKDIAGGNLNNPVYDLLSPGSLFDFLNFPTFNSLSDFNAGIGKAKDHKVDMMVFNAYNLIYNEYFRDENLQPEVFIWSLSGRHDNISDLSDYQTEVASDYGVGASVFVLPWILRHRAWRKDYFTSALPFVQKGTSISLMSSVSPVDGGNNISVHFAHSKLNLGDPEDWFVNIHQQTSPTLSMEGNLYATAKSSPIQPGDYVSPDQYSNTNGILAWVSLPEFQSSVMTISNLRVGLALQQWFELNARTGSDRYFEYLLGHFGVRDRDSRMQRPEYIGGYSHSIQISEVEQTSSTDGTTPQGNLAGRGLGFSTNRPCRYRCPEPGWIIGVQSIRPRAVYWQGWPRMYQRWDSFDYYDPLFDHLSEQAIKSSEIFWDPSIEPLSEQDVDFGYTPRFSEYRWFGAQLHGDFRATFSYWVSPRKFSQAPRLNSDFISIDGYSQSLYDMFAYPGTSQAPAPHFICHVVNHIRAIRPMSKYATPYL